LETGYDELLVAGCLPNGENRKVLPMKKYILTPVLPSLLQHACHRLLEHFGMFSES
jgi:hypothetical protein